MAAAVIVVLIIILAAMIKPIVNFATAQPQNATLVAALIALLGILATQIVNTWLSFAEHRAGARNLRVLEDRRAQAASLQSYLELMGDLLLNHQLGTDNLIVERRIHNAKDESENARVVAQAHTLAVLEGMDSITKMYLLQFLYYSGLIHKDKSAISLTGANLSRAYLHEANLRDANLRGADLRGADLTRAN